MKVKGHNYPTPGMLKIAEEDTIDSLFWLIQAVTDYRAGVWEAADGSIWVC